MNSESHGELICIFGYCRQHASLGTQKSRVQIKHVDTEAGRWTAKGAGVCGVPSQDGTPCRTICITITEHLPVEFRDLPCPSCDQVVNYKYTLECLHIDKRKYEFTASVTCPRCNKQSVFSRIARSLRRVKRLRVGPTGLELETHDR